MAASADQGYQRTDFAGVAVQELAERFGTPLYVYDAQQIVRRVRDLQRFDVVRYAQKASSNVALLKLMRNMGVLVDAVSAGELVRAAQAGYGLRASEEPHQVVYTADIFDREALEMVVREGVHCNLGSPDMIDQLGARAPGACVTLRVNPGFGHGHSQKTNTGGPQSKHGIWHEDIPDCLRRAERHGVTITGLHMHIGSGTDLEHLGQVCGAMESIALDIGASIQTISAGGGLPIAYRSDEETVDLSEYYRLWHNTRQRLQDAFSHPLHLEIEPGRYLVAEAGAMICEIRAIKTMGGNRFYLVDAGFNNLARPVLYGAFHPMVIAPRDGRDLGPLQPVVVGGPLCESGDIFTQTEGGFVQYRELPTAQVGDFLVIQCAGAYGFTMASNYNSKPLSAEVLVLDRQPLLIRERQSLQALVADERIPDALEGFPRE